MQSPGNLLTAIVLLMFTEFSLGHRSEEMSMQGMTALPNLYGAQTTMTVCISDLASEVISNQRQEQPRLTKDDWTLPSMALLI